MTGSRLRVGLIAAAVTLVVLPLLRAQQQQISSPDQTERAKAIELMRMINTTEVEYRSHPAVLALGSGFDRFGSWGEIYQAILNNERRRNEANRLQLSAGPEVMPGWQIKLVVSADGKTYSVTLQDKKDGDGLFSIFSDQDGVIFLGSPIG